MHLLICFLFLLSILPLAQANEELTVCTRGMVDSFVVPESLGSTAHQLLPKNLYNNLVVWDTEQKMYIPDLAESWSSHNKTIYHFKLKENIQFHRRPWFEPTRQLAAEDIIYTFTQLMHDPELKRNWPFFNNTIESIKGDKYRVQFTLKQPSIDFIAQLGASYAIIRSAEYAQYQRQQDGVRLPVGTGPFMLQVFNERQQLLVRNPNYRKHIDLKRLIFRSIPEEQERYTQLRIGACALNTHLHGPLIAAAESLSDIDIARTTRPVLLHLNLDTRTPLLQDLRVRQIVAASIDKKRLARLVYHREDFAAREIEQGKHREGAKDIDVYDPDYARQRLRDLNISQPTLIEYSTQLHQKYIATQQASKVLAEFFRNIGFRYEKKIVSAEEMEKFQDTDALAKPNLRKNEGAFSLNLKGTSLPSSSLAVYSLKLLDKLNTDSKLKCCKHTRSLVKDFENSTTLEARTEARYRAADEANRLKTLIPLAHIGEFVHAWRNNISGVVRGPMGLWDFSSVKVR